MTPIYAVLSDDSAMIETAARCGAEVILTSQLNRTVSHRLFDKSIHRSASRMNGLWVFSTERFFYLEEAMRYLGSDRALHLESDNLIFFDVAEADAAFTRLYSGLAAPFLNDDSCIPGVVYVASLAALAELTAYLAAQVSRARYGQWRSLFGLTRARMGDLLNDMRLLAAFRDHVGSPAFSVLPMVPPDYDAEMKANPAVSLPRRLDYSTALSTLQMVFDAAAIGQFINGVDQTFHAAAPNDSFVNVSSILNPNDFTFAVEWDIAGRIRPTMIRNGTRYRIASIHNHAKGDLMSRLSAAC